MIEFLNLTIPTAEPYSKQEPTRQQENVCYVLLQLLAQLKTKQETLELNQVAHQTVNVDLTELTNAVKALEFLSFLVDFGGFTVSITGPGGAVLSRRL